MSEEIKALLGKTLTSVFIDNRSDAPDTIDFDTSDGERFRLFHSQDCCEVVSLAEVIGDIDDLIGSPILEAECVESERNAEPRPEEVDDSWTWTFYKLGTIKGSVTLRWVGTSNGYYSEAVDFAKVAT